MVTPPFTPGAAVLVDGYDITALPAGEHEFGRSADFLVQRRGTAHAAWAQWIGAPGLLRGRARIVALSCVHCAARTELTCCDTALCPSHHDHHRAVEHAPPGGGRYRALLDAPADLRFPDTPEPTPIPGLRAPRDRDLPPVARPRTGDGLRVLHHLRGLLIVPGQDDDPIGDVLRAVVAGDATLPSPTRTRSLVADILGRCTWPAFCDALGHHDLADWLRAQPAPSNRAGTPPSAEQSELDGRLSGIGSGTAVSHAGAIAARDALCGLWRTAPTDLGGGVLGLSGRLGDAVFTRALALPDGADHVGHAVTRAQQDAVRMVIAATTAD
ncbi:MAG: hypothetical protein ABIQ18_16120 [Umezawaea sp.]